MESSIGFGTSPAWAATVGDSRSEAAAMRHVGWRRGEDEADLVRREEAFSFFEIGIFYYIYIYIVSFVLAACG